MRALVLMVAFCTMVYSSLAKPGILAQYPRVGSRCPDFTLHDIRYYPLKQATLKDFAGKWLVLDFWSKNCGSCVAHFPETNEMQRRFGSRVTFMLVGLEDRENEIRGMYARFREREKLQMPCAFDSATVHRFVCGGFPHTVIIDSNGIVRGITSSISIRQMQEFLDGNTPALKRAATCDPLADHKIPFDGRKPYLMNGNGGLDSDFLFRSVLTRWNPENQGQYSPSLLDRHSVDNGFPAGIFQVLGAPLNDLYKWAYFGKDGWGCSDTTLYGKYFGEPIIETKDSGLFSFKFGPVYKNLFCYSMVIPKEQGTSTRMQQIMQGDLKNYFGFDVAIETRRFPCWKLVATDKARANLRTAGGEPDQIEIIPRAKYKLQNLPVKQLYWLIGRLGDPILDETGIQGNIDITMECVTNDDILRSLHENGLSLVPAEKEMKVLVIRDPKETPVSVTP